MGRMILRAVFLLAAVGAVDDPWLRPQAWRRDSPAPCLPLGKPGEFDDMHLFAPCVAREEAGFRMWYCGSRGSVRDRDGGLGRPETLMLHAGLGPPASSEIRGASPTSGACRSGWWTG